MRRRPLRQKADVDLQARCKEVLDDPRSITHTLRGARTAAQVDRRPRAVGRLRAAGLGPRGSLALLVLRRSTSPDEARAGTSTSRGGSSRATIALRMWWSWPPTSPRDMPVAPVSLEPRSLSKLRARLEQVERELEELDYRRIGLTLYRDMLHEALDEADDRAARERAALVTLDQDQVFAVQGWAPRARAAAAAAVRHGSQAGADDRGAGCSGHTTNTARQSASPARWGGDGDVLQDPGIFHLGPFESGIFRRSPFFSA